MTPDKSKVKEAMCDCKDIKLPPFHTPDYHDKGSKAGFTPGPWEISPSFDVVDSNGLLVAVPAGQTKENIQANTQLIASAPELLELLKDISCLRPFKNGEYKIMAERIEQAIAKATGNT